MRFENLLQKVCVGISSAFSILSRMGKGVCHLDVVSHECVGRIGEMSIFVVTACGFVSE